MFRLTPPHELCDKTFPILGIFILFTYVGQWERFGFGFCLVKWTVLKVFGHWRSVTNTPSVHSAEQTAELPNLKENKCEKQKYAQISEEKKKRITIFRSYYNTYEYVYFYFFYMILTSNPWVLTDTQYCSNVDVCKRKSNQSGLGILSIRSSPNSKYLSLDWDGVRPDQTPPHEWNQPKSQGWRQLSSSEWISVFRS